MSTHTHNEATSDWAAVIHKFGRDKVLPRSSELDAHPQDMELIRSLLLEVGRIGLIALAIVSLPFRCRGVWPPYCVAIITFQEGDNGNEELEQSSWQH